MIVTLLLWCLVTLTLFAYGISCSKILRVAGILSEDETDFYRICLWGLSFLSTLLAIISFFSAINYVVFWVLTGLTVIQLAFYWKDFIKIFERIRSSKGILPSAVVGLIILLYAIRSEYTNNDTGLYHAQAIQWIEKYPVVPGLGNLHGALGDNIHFFLLSAFFGLSFSGVFFHVLNSWLILFFCFYSIRNFYKTDSARKKIIYVSFIILCFIYRFKLGLPNTDLPIAILTVIIFSLLLDYFDPHFKGERYNTLVLIAVTGFLGLTFKLSFSILFAFIFIFLIYIKWKESYKSLMKIVFLFGLISIPWLARNVVLSGYLLYPVSTFDVFNFSWKIPEDDVRRTQTIITTWNTDPTFLKSPLIEELTEIPKRNIFHASITTWFHQRTTMDKVYLIAFILSFFLSLAFAILRIKSREFEYLPVISIWLVLLVSSFAWFSTGPDMRFFLGTMWVSFSIPLMLSPGFKIIRTGAMYLLSGYLIIFIGLYYAIEPLGQIMDGKLKVARYFLLPESRYPKIETISFYENNFNAIRPKEGLDCWNEALPCLPCEFMHVKMRGSSFKDGFISTDR